MMPIKLGGRQQAVPSAAVLVLAVTVAAGIKVYLSGSYEVLVDCRWWAGSLAVSAAGTTATWLVMHKLTKR